MRSTRCAAMLAVVASGGAVIPASAQAFKNRNYGRLPGVRVAAIQHASSRPTSSPGFTTVGAGAVVGMTLLGTGSARRARRRVRAC
jgi:hypothetical protein